MVEPSTINKTAPPVAETALLPQKRVAVCISGLPLRLLTASLIHNMVAPNVPAWSFDIVYALSADRLPISLVQVRSPRHWAYCLKQNSPRRYLS